MIRPVVVGGGKPALPTDGRVELELMDERRFTSGVVYLRYRNLTEQSQATTPDKTTLWTESLRHADRFPLDSASRPATSSP